MECFGDYNFDEVRSPSAEELVEMRRVSPVSLVDAVRAPTLICVGGEDRRVPPSQGTEYFHLLRSRGVATK